MKTALIQVTTKEGMAGIVHGKIFEAMIPGVTNAASADSTLIVSVEYDSETEGDTDSSIVPAARDTIVLLDQENILSAKIQWP